MSERIVHLIPNLQTKSMNGKLWAFMRVSVLHIRLSSIASLYNSLPSSSAYIIPFSQALNCISHIIEHQSQLRQGLEIAHGKADILEMI